MTETWTAPELREHLGQVGVVPELVVPVRVTGADLGPPTAQDRARTRKLVVAVGAVVILALVVTAALRQALREGFTSGSVLLVLLLVSQVALRWFGGPSIMGAPSAGSEADLFVTALRTPTAAVRSVRRRWLVVVDAGRQLVVTEEEGWSVRGPEQILEIRWSDKNGRIVSTADVRRHFRRWIQLRFADGSVIALLLGRSARMQLADAISRVGPGGG